MKLIATFHNRRCDKGMLTMRSALILALFLVTGSAFGQSKETEKPISPIASETKEADKPKGNAEKKRTVSIELPPTINITVSGKLETNSDDAKPNADAESTRWSDPISIFTGLLVAVTGGLILVGWRQVQTARTIERAYVKMSHFPPGLIIVRDTGICWVRVSVKNYGRTPARITGAILKLVPLPNSESLPVIPDYRIERAQEQHKVFLVAGDEFFFSQWFNKLEVANLPDVESGGTKLWVYGYVDYIDKFEQRHRAGYARVYDRIADARSSYRSDEEFEKRSNLVFFPQEGYNYDRRRKKDEGDDRDEKTPS